MAEVKGFFDELGYADSADLAVKTQAAILVAKGIRSRGLKQKDFAQQIGWKPPTVSALVRGELDLFSWNRINQALAPFGKRVETRHEIVDAS